MAYNPHAPYGGGSEHPSTWGPCFSPSNNYSVPTGSGRPHEHPLGPGFPGGYNYPADIEIKSEPQDPDSMSLWVQVQQLPCEAMRQVQGLYGVHFPMEVRHFFAEWIEQQPWNQIDEDNIGHEAKATDLRNQLIGIIEKRVQELITDDMFPTKLKFQQTIQQFKEIYGNRPMNLVRVLKNCLNTEHRLVETYLRGSSQEGTDCQEASMHRQVLQQFQLLEAYTAETEDDLRQLQQEQETFIIQYQENNKINNQLQALQNQPNGQTRTENEQRLQQQKLKIENDLRKMAQDLLDRRLMLANKHKQTFEQLAKLQEHILDTQLISWKRQQQLAGNGSNFDGSLDNLQHWCESLAELIWRNRQQIKKVEVQRAQLPIDIPTGQEDLLPYLNTTITSLLSSLVTSTFIIEKQPPQVLKKEARFTATVRLLVGGKLNVHMNPPVVKATIISEEQARAILKNDKNAKSETSGDILNNQGSMEYHQANGQLAVTFRNMQLKRIRRAEKKGNEVVTEVKSSILFRSQFSIGGGELVFQTWTLSLPVVVTVHGNQECNALATVLWDNAFAEPGRVPFQVPDKVLWPALANALNLKFASSCGLGLSNENIHYLASKLFGMSGDYSNQVVTWSQFNREPLPGRNFTFWEWFYSVLKLTKDWLAGPWKQGLIMGFVNKQKAQEWLKQKPTGTFLLRYSDSEVGGITIAWVDYDKDNPAELQVWNLAPFTEKDFKIRGLGDRIKDLDNLVNLYPDTPKEKAFCKFWTQTSDAAAEAGKDGYVRPDLNIILPTWLQKTHMGVVSIENPATPQAPSQPIHSPPMEMMPNTPQGGATSDMEYGYGRMDQSEQNDGFLPQLDDLDSFTTTDYNPADIEQINVNELLNNQ